MGLDGTHLERYMSTDDQCVHQPAAQSPESWGTLEEAVDKKEMGGKDFSEAEEFAGPPGSSWEGPPDDSSPVVKNASAAHMPAPSGSSSSKVDVRRTIGAICEETSAMGRARQLVNVLNMDASRKIGSGRGRDEDDLPGRTGKQSGKDKHRNPVRSWIELGLSRGVRPAADQLLKSRDSELQRSIKSCLKQVGFEDTDRIVDNIARIELRKAQDLEMVVKLLFDAALTAPHDCEVYADIVMGLTTRCPEFKAESANDPPITFPRVLLNTCQNEYESMPRWLQEPKTRDRNKSRSPKAVALIRFLGSLFVRRLAAMRVIGTVLQDLLGARDTNPEELEIYCACELLIVVGSALEGNPQGKLLVQTIANRLTEIKEACNDDGSRLYSEEVQSQIDDVLDLSRNSWVWHLQVVVQLEDDNVDVGVPRIICRSLSGEECASVAGQLCYARPSSLRAQIADQLDIHPSRLRMLLPDSSIFE